MRKKLLFITTRLFWPTDEGHKVLLHNYCRGLSEYYNYDIYLYSFLEAGQSANQPGRPDYIKEIYTAVPLNTLQKAGNALRHSLVGRSRWSIQSSMYISEMNKSNIRKLIAELKPDAIIVDMIRLNHYYEALSDYNGPKILFMEDALSKRYPRQMKQKSAKADITGRYGANLPKFIRRMVNSAVLRNFVLSLETKRLETEEVEAAKKYDAVIYVNSIEANEMNQKTGKNNSYTVTMGADCNFFGADLEVEKKPNTLSYVGNMAVAANADAVRMIMDEIMPLIPSKPVIHFIGNCPDTLKEEYADNDQCIFDGRVDDVRKYVKATEVVLSPIAYGTGVKTKVIEGMAMAMPVVTNYLGIDGLSVEVGHDLLMSDNYSEIAAMVEELLHNPEKQMMLGRNGREYALKNHGWEDIYKVFGQMGL